MGRHATLLAAGECRLRRRQALHRRLIALRASHPALSRSRRVDARAIADATVVTLTRRNPMGSAVAVFNLGPDPAPAAAPSLTTGAGPTEGAWAQLIDSADPALGGSGVLMPDEWPAGLPVELGPWSFCVYGCGPERAITGS
jgi:hypothetical protein